MLDVGYEKDIEGSVASVDCSVSICEANDEREQV